jgi:alkylhydroperoxidase family enzyme
MEMRARLERLSTAAAALAKAVLHEPAQTPIETRTMAYDGSATDAAVLDYVTLVEKHAYRVTDGQVTAMRELGLSDDGIFELTVAAALGAAQRRLDAAKALVETTPGS